MRSLREMLAGASLSLIVIALVAIASLDVQPENTFRTDQANVKHYSRVGQSDVFYHFEESPDAFELYVVVVSKTDVADTLKTRMQMRDGQRLSVILHDPDHAEDHQAHKLIFDRVGRTVVATPIEAKRKTMIAALSAPSR